MKESAKNTATAHILTVKGKTKEEPGNECKIEN